MAGLRRVVFGFDSPSVFFFDAVRRAAGFFSEPSFVAALFRLRGSVDFEVVLDRVLFSEGGSALAGSVGDHTPRADCDSALSSANCPTG